MSALCGFLPITTIGGLLMPNLDILLRNEYQTAYISSTTGGTGETRPVLAQTLAGSYSFGEWGSVGGYVWTRSALTGQRDEYRRRAFESFEYGLEYEYTWKFTDDLGLYSYIDHFWSPSPGWYVRGQPLYAVTVEQAFNNPWIDPYYIFTGSYHPEQWETLKIGLRRKFKMLEDCLAVVPYGELVCGDGRRYAAKYGNSPFDTYCCVGPLASEFGVKVTYEITKFLSARLKLRNWNLIDHAAREREKDMDEPWHVCWLPAASLAIDLRF